MHIDKVEVQGDYQEEDKQIWIYEKVVVHARPYERLQRCYPCCGLKCPGYDTKQPEESTWRGPNLNGMIVEVKYQPKRIYCPTHGVRTEWMEGLVRGGISKIKKLITHRFRSPYLG